jgi:hypothetical protein
VRKEDKKMKKKILVGLLLAGSTMFAAPRVSFGVGFGAPVVEAVPPCPGPGYVFLNGYWQLPGRDRVLHSDYRRDNFRREPEHFEHFDRQHAEHFRR